MLVIFCLKGGRPYTPSTPELELEKPMSHLPNSIASTFPTPPPGETAIVTPGMPFWMASAIAPPKGYQEPPIGPVIIFRSNFWAKTEEPQRRKNKDKHTNTICNLFIVPSS